MLVRWTFSEEAVIDFLVENSTEIMDQLRFDIMYQISPFEMSSIMKLITYDAFMGELREKWYTTMAM